MSTKKTKIFLKVYMSKEEKEMVEEYAASKKDNVSNLVRNLVFQEIGYQRTK